MRLGNVRCVHFIGIGGSGMSGIAEVLLNLGYQVSGSDAQPSEITSRLVELGARVHADHAADHVRGADVVVVSSAVPSANPEIVEAHRLRIPVIPRAEMLGELMRMKHSVAVAGSHGKTSVTAMLALVLSRSGLDPTVVSGGRLGVLGSNAKLGRGDLLVAEADESDGSFLRLFPTIAVVTGIDREHMAHYGTLENLHEAFVQFLAKIPFFGAAVTCLDDEGLQAVLPRLDRRVVTYGLATQADFRASDVETRGFASRFMLRHGSAPGLRVSLNTPGRHQVLNALATLAVTDELGLSLRVAAAALEEFPGADRRMQRLGEPGGVLVVDDYGHHPTEIVATLVALREAVGERRIMVLFQPHRYSRTADLFEVFTRSFYEADALILTEIYAAGEPPVGGVNAEKLAAAIAEHGHRDVCFAGSIDDAIETLLDRARMGDVVLTLGAGSVGRAGARIVERLAARSGQTA
ncbi:MAG: UDP-N-acetylmuramate--L-alanine ligase [Acidobacteriota bacterium]|nr:MAG: UDP-N-acetylmuramate--L-alanine ligase [Acidobacteriota bacterium]